MTRLLAAAAFVLIAACGGGQLRTDGVVVDVVGSIVEVDSFTVRTPDGADLTFIPQARLLFDGGPLSHLSEHLRSGERVHVEYEETDDDVLLATKVGDAG